MQKIFAILLLVMGVGVCVWGLYSAGVFGDADVVHLEPRFYVGVGWTLCGVVAVIRAFRRRGADKS